MTSLKNRSIPRSQLIPAAISAVLFLSIAMFVFWAGNLTVNMTSSMPMGIWSVKDLDSYEDISRGSIVLFCPPDTKLFRKAKAEGILHGGSCNGSYTPLLKQVWGIAGDTIEYSGTFYLNGHEIGNSKILPVAFGEFRTDRSFSIVVPKGKIWLMSTYSFLSFDSRYFGLVDDERILGLANEVFSMR